MHTAPDILDTELIWSYDAKNWNRNSERNPFIPLGEKDNLIPSGLILQLIPCSLTTINSGSTIQQATWSTESPDVVAPYA